MVLSMSSSWGSWRWRLLHQSSLFRRPGTCEYKIESCTVVGHRLQSIPIDWENCFKVFGFYSRGTENGSRWILNRFLVCQAILLRNRSLKPWNMFYAPPPILNEYMGCSKQFMICSHHCFWSLVWPLECEGWLAGCISRPQTAFYGLDMQPASQPSHSKGHTRLQKK